MTQNPSLQEVIQNFIGDGPKFSILGLEIPIYGLLALGIGIIFIILVMRLLKRLLFRLAKYNGFPAEIYNGILFVLRLLVGVLIIWLILTFLNIESDYILIISGIAGTAIAFASVKTINNFVAGVWIAVTTPYLLGDYVKIGTVEGIVVKITSFYTRIKTFRENTVLIPNLTCLNSNILNYSINIMSYDSKIKILKKNIADLENKKSKRLKKNNELRIAQFKSEIQEKEATLQNIQKYRNKLKENQELKGLSDFAHSDKVIRYVFTLDLPKKFTFIESSLKNLHAKWEKKYKFDVSIALINITSHLVYEFTLTTLDPMDILAYYAELVNDMYQIIYQKSEI